MKYLKTYESFQSVSHWDAYRNKDKKQDVGWTERNFSRNSEMLIKDLCKRKNIAEPKAESIKQIIDEANNYLSQVSATFISENVLLAMINSYIN